MSYRTSPEKGTVLQDIYFNVETTFAMEEFHHSKISKFIPSFTC